MDIQPISVTKPRFSGIVVTHFWDNPREPLASISLFSSPVRGMKSHSGMDIDLDSGDLVVITGAEEDEPINKVLLSERERRELRVLEERMKYARLLDLDDDQAILSYTDKLSIVVGRFVARVLERVRIDMGLFESTEVKLVNLYPGQGDDDSKPPYREVTKEPCMEMYYTKG